MVKTALLLTIINITTVFQVKKHYLRCLFCFNQHQKIWQTIYKSLSAKVKM